MKKLVLIITIFSFEVCFAAASNLNIVSGFLNRCIEQLTAPLDKEETDLLWALTEGASESDKCSQWTTRLGAQLSSTMRNHPNQTRTESREDVSLTKQDRVVFCNNIASELYTSHFGGVSPYCSEGAYSQETVDRFRNACIQYNMRNDDVPEGVDPTIMRYGRKFEELFSRFEEISAKQSSLSGDVVSLRGVDQATSNKHSLICLPSSRNQVLTCENSPKMEEMKELYRTKICPGVTQREGAEHLHGACFFLASEHSIKMALQRQEFISESVNEDVSSLSADILDNIYLRQQVEENQNSPAEQLHNNFIHRYIMENMADLPSEERQENLQSVWEVFSKVRSGERQVVSVADFSNLVFSEKYNGQTTTEEVRRRVQESFVHYINHHKEYEEKVNSAFNTLSLIQSIRENPAFVPSEAILAESNEQLILSAMNKKPDDEVLERAMAIVDTVKKAELSIRAANNDEEEISDRDLNLRIYSLLHRVAGDFQNRSCANIEQERKELCEDMSNNRLLINEEEELTCLDGLIDNSDDSFERFLVEFDQELAQNSKGYLMAQSCHLVMDENVNKASRYNFRTMMAGNNVEPGQAPVLVNDEESDGTGRGNGPIKGNGGPVSPFDKFAEAVNDDYGNRRSEAPAPLFDNNFEMMDSHLPSSSDRLTNGKGSPSDSANNEHSLTRDHGPAGGVVSEAGKADFESFDYQDGTMAAQGVANQLLQGNETGRLVADGGTEDFAEDGSTLGPVGESTEDESYSDLLDTINSLQSELRAERGSDNDARYQALQQQLLESQKRFDELEQSMQEEDSEIVDHAPAQVAAADPQLREASDGDIIRRRTSGGYKGGTASDTDSGELDGSVPATTAAAPAAVNNNIRIRLPSDTTAGGKEGASGETSISGTSTGGSSSLALSIATPSPGDYMVVDFSDVEGKVVMTEVVTKDILKVGEPIYKELERGVYQEFTLQENGEIEQRRVIIRDMISQLSDEYQNIARDIVRVEMFDNL